MNAINRKVLESAIDSALDGELEIPPMSEIMNEIVGFRIVAVHERGCHCTSTFIEADCALRGCK